MKSPINKLKTLSILVLAMTLVFMGCESDKLSNLAGPDSQSFQGSQAQSQPNFLKMKGSDNTLNKKKNKKKHVNKYNGGVLNVVHGNASGTAKSGMLANNWNPPYNVYTINPQYPDRHAVVGQLAFKSAAMAMHPLTGKVYYVGNRAENDVYPVGVWDPETNTNTILPEGSSFKPCGKLAFHPDGTLFGLKRADTRQLYTIDVSSGEWTLFATLDKYLKAGGGMTFTPDGQNFYSTGGRDPYLQIIELASARVTNLRRPGPSNISGLCFSSDGHLYVATRSGAIGTANPQTGAGHFITNTGIAEINSLIAVISSTELSFAELTLEVLPNSIDQDKEIEISLETTELSGGVWVTFQPHGTVFSPPVVLNFVAHGVDFTGIDPSTVNIYYDNPDTGQWEPMPCDDVIVNVNAGTLRVINARLPHFSRYGVAAD